jgi:nucleotide-binding universal stress UspA family protein
MKILVAYDGSGRGRDVLRWAARLARAEADSKVTVICVAAALEASPPIADAVDPSSTVEAHRAHLADAGAALAADGVQADTVLKVGNPAEEIINAGDDGDYELILIGATGSHHAMRFLMGSVSDRVARHASRPVLIVR